MVRWKEVWDLFEGLISSQGDAVCGRGGAGSTRIHQDNEVE